ncbi:MAG: C45 family autoproteolytic acyltransferase/hydrolase [Anaerolineae bacterium]|jgi:hypothetical protein
MNNRILTKPQIQPLALEGTPYQRGLAHGETLRSQIQELIGIWKADLSAVFRTGADLHLHTFLQRTDFLPAIRQWTPDLLDEIRGIADGSAQPFESLLAFQLLDELWAYNETATVPHCTSMGLRADAGQPTCVAQTIDVETFRHGFQTVLHIRYPDSDLEAFAVTSAGLIAFNGMNNRGVGICCNFLPLTSRQQGLPVACIVRGVLARETVQEARDFLQRLPHASGQNYLVGGPDSVFDLECSASQVVAYEPNGWQDILWHANLPLANDDLKPHFRNAMESSDENPFIRNNRTRFQAVELRLRKAPWQARLDFLRETLASRDSDQNPICSIGDEREFFAGEGIYSFASTVMKLSAEPELHASFSPSDPSSYTRLRFAGGAQPAGLLPRALRQAERKPAEGDDIA